MHQISICKGILKQSCDCVNIVLGHFTNVLEHETEGLQNTVLDIELRDSILVHKSWNNCEWATSFSNNSDSDSRTNSALSLLDFKIVHQSVQDILRADSLSNVTKGIYSSSSNTLLMGSKEVKEIEADSHPFLSGDIFGTSVSNTTNQVDAVFLDF